LIHNRADGFKNAHWGLNAFRPSARIACLRWNPVTWVNRSRIFCFSSRSVARYCPARASINSLLLPNSVASFCCPLFVNSQVTFHEATASCWLQN
jgi:hypothetical protein